VVQDLMGRGLPDIDVGQARPVGGGNAIGMHQSPPLVLRPVARSGTLWPSR
jgi:hypothetical protein